MTLAEARPDLGTGQFDRGNAGRKPDARAISETGAGGINAGADRVIQ